MVTPSVPAAGHGWAVLAAAALSWLGLLIHNVADLPGQTLLSPESAYPAAVLTVIVALWFSAGRRVAAWLLLGWGLLHLIGGSVVSVLPLAVLPFDPEQSIRHYAFHVLYGVMQAPLLVVVSVYLRRTERQRPRARWR